MKAQARVEVRAEPVVSKTCGGCRLAKPIKDFTKHAQRTDGLSFYCKVCKKGRAAKYRANNPSAYKRYKYDCRDKNIANYFLQRAHSRARALGLPFDLTSEDIVLPTHCPVLGIELKIGIGSKSDASPSIDRLIPSLGYVKGNVCVISMRANRIKNNATAEELMAIACWMNKQEAH